MENEKEKYQVELVWNREFHFVPFGPWHDDVKAAVSYAQDIQNSGDGERVKKTQVIDDEGNIVWQYGRFTKLKK